MSTRPLSCTECGIASFEVRPALVEKPSGPGEYTYASEPRCRDRDACADRVKAIEEAQGEPKEWAL